MSAFDDPPRSPRPGLRICPPVARNMQSVVKERTLSRRIWTFEPSKIVYVADFLVYGLLIASLMGVLIFTGPSTLWPWFVLNGILGLALWTLMEYVMHRFVLHGLSPFKELHELHHFRPRDLMGTPTLATLMSFAVFVFLPAFWFGNLWVACALCAGALMGYLAYSLLHHATHHWRLSSRWLKGRKKIHGLHHQFGRPGYFGVTTSFWDHVFGSTRSE